MHMNAQFLYGITQSEATDNFDIRVQASPQVTEAFVHCFKCTPDEVFLRIDAFIIRGLAGIIALQGQNKTMQFKTEICEMVMNGFHKCLDCLVVASEPDDIVVGAIMTEKKNIPAKDIPTQMSWSHYKVLVCKWGVELCGWTEDQVAHPGLIEAVPALKMLLDALCKGHCYWRKLTEVEWKSKVEEHEDTVPKSCKWRSDHGTTKKPSKTRKVRRDQTPSASPSLASDDESLSDVDEDKDEDDEEEEEEQEEQE